MKAGTLATRDALNALQPGFLSDSADDQEQALALSDDDSADLLSDDDQHENCHTTCPSRGARSGVHKATWRRCKLVL